MAQRLKRKKPIAPSRPPVSAVAARRPFPWIVLLQAAIIIALGIWIYQPSLHGLWLWDDDFLIQNNDEVHDPRGLWYIWFAPSTLIDYFPLTVSVEWLIWQIGQIWGNDTGDPNHNNLTVYYHLTGLIFHLISAMLVWHLFSKLKIRLAWLGALLFTVHPVIVESVAWMAELKNTLAMPPFLLCLCCWVDYDRTRRTEYYVAAWFLFLIAMLCKTSVVMFPVIILLHVWWRRQRIDGGDIARSLPFFVISGALSAALIAYLRHGVGEQFIPLGGPLSRLACAGLSLAFYFSKAILPVNLLPIYPQWDINPPSLIQFLPWPVLGLGLYWLWRKHDPWARTALFGFGFFFLNLLPFVGFRAISFMRFGWVMDHFLYVPILGLFGLAAAAVGHLDEILSPATRSWRYGAIAVVLAVFTIGSHRYTKAYVDRLAYWTYAARHNFVAWPAHNNRGNQLLDDGRYTEAQEEFEIALALNPKYTEAHNNLGFVFGRQRRLKEAEAEFRKALFYTPDFESAQINLKKVLELEATPKQ